VVFGVPYPIEVKLPGVRVVSLVASGMLVFRKFFLNYNLMEILGPFTLWTRWETSTFGVSIQIMQGLGAHISAGTLDGSSFAHDNQGFSHAGRKAGSPHRLKMPAPIRSIR